MSKKLILTVLAAALIVVIIGLVSSIYSARQTEEGSSEESIELHDEILILPSEMPDGISFEIPSGFTETASEYYDKYYVKNDASVIVTGDTLPNYNQSLEDFTAGVKEQYEQTADHFRLLSEESATISGVPCRLLEFTYDIVGSESAQSMECTTAIMIRGGKVYILTCKSHLDTYSGYRNVFRRMIETIKLTDPGAEPQQEAPAQDDVSGQNPVQTEPEAAQ